MVDGTTLCPKQNRGAPTPFTSARKAPPVASAAKKNAREGQAGVHNSGDVRFTYGSEVLAFRLICSQVETY